MPDQAEHSVATPSGVFVPAPWRLPSFVLLMLAYIFSGKLGLLLAIPPGYASAIFPPAGIAVAAVLTGGFATLPWIFAGSAVLNLWVSWAVPGQIGLASAAAAALIAFASALQAAAGGAILRRALGQPAAMDHEQPLVRFVLLAPLICLVSASFSVAGLHLLDFITQENLVASWFTWWIGDTLGVLVILPLTLVLTGMPRALWRSRAATVGGPILLGFGLFVAIFVRFSGWEQQQSLLEFSLLSQQTADRIETRLEAQEVLLEQTASLLGGGESVTHKDFQHFVEQTLVRYPMVKAVEWVPRVTAAQRAAFEAHEHIEIHEFSTDLARVLRTPERAVYYPVAYVEPREGNEGVAGVNLINRIGVTALNNAMARDRAIATAPLHLLQDRASAESSPGVLIVYPVHAGANGPGFVLSVLRMNEFMDRILPFVNGQLSVRLTDKDAGLALYDSFDKASAEPLYETGFDFGGRHYRLQTLPSADYVHAHRGWQSWSVLVVGLLFIALLAAALLLSTGHAARTEALVIARTADLRDEKIFSETVINSLPGVFYLLDDAGRLVHWNRNFKTVFGRSESDLKLGDVFKSTIEEDRALAEDTIRRIHVSRGYAEVELRQRVADGAVRRYLTNGQYIEIAGKPYLLGTGLDVTERREMEQEVLRSRKVLRTLIDAAPAWLSMIDREGHMVIANRRYSETFGLKAGFIEGRHYSAVLPAETSIRLQPLFDDCFAGREIEFDDEWNVRGRPTMSVHGKCVPIFEGDVVVSIVTAIMDLTEIQNAQSRLRGANAELERRVEEIRALQTLLQEQAIRDPLSGLYNRRYLDEMLDRELAKAQREGYPVSIVMGDIDRFKKLNDTYGHQAGDEVIRGLARLLREHARAGDILCRFGGEEFLLVLPGLGLEAAFERVDQWRNEFAAQRLSFGALELSSTISFGIAAYPAHGKSADRLIAAADQALYLAKANGRNRVELSKL